MSKAEWKIGFDISYYDATTGSHCEWSVCNNKGGRKPCGRKAAFLVSFNMNDQGEFDEPTNTLEIHLCKSHVVKLGLDILAITGD